MIKDIIFPEDIYQQNIDSFRSPMQQPYRSYSPPSNVRELSNKQQTNIENFGDLPILE